MAEFISTNISLSDIASAVDHDLDDLFNAIGYHLAGAAGVDLKEAADDILKWLEKHCGDDLDVDGKAFLRACADYYDRQFPGER